MACGFEGKECAICGVGNGCIAAMHDDYFYPATKEELIKRLDTGKFPAYRDLMIKTLKERFNYEYGVEGCCCVNLRETWKEKPDLVMTILEHQAKTIDEQREVIAKLREKISKAQKDLED